MLGEREKILLGLILWQTLKHYNKVQYYSALAKLYIP